MMFQVQIDELYRMQYLLFQKTPPSIAKSPFYTGIENGNFSKWRNSRIQPALKTGVFQNGGISVFYRH
jgi:hypothetical protein